MRKFFKKIIGIKKLEKELHSGDTTAGSGFPKRHSSIKPPYNEDSSIIINNTHICIYYQTKNSLRYEIRINGLLFGRYSDKETAKRHASAYYDAIMSSEFV